MKTLWFHVHVPKAGGSTLRQLMNRNFGKGYYNSVSLLESKQYSRQDVVEIAKSQPWLHCMSDHKLSLDLPYDFKEAEIHAFAFVREPVDRYVSRYFYHRSADIECAARTAQDFREFVEYELVQGHVEPHVRSQVCFLNYGRADDDLQIVENAISTGRVCLFPIERMDEACVYLEQRFPETFRDLSCVAVNQAERTQSIADEDLALVRKHVAADLPLYDMAGRYLDSELQRLFPDPDRLEMALRDYQARCAVRRDNFNPLFLERGAWDVAAVA